MRWSLSTVVGLLAIYLQATGVVALPTDSQLSSSAAGSPVQALVDLGYAKYQGLTDTSKGYLRFYNVKYAAPPVGKLSS